MKAIVQHRYGDPSEVLELQEIDRPTPREDEVLVRVRVRAASLHPDVWHVVTGRPYVLRLMGAGLRKPGNPVPGTDAAGLVEAVGRDVTRFEPGDEVYGETVRGHQWKNGGAFAEHVAVDADALLPKPERLSFGEAAAVPTSGSQAVQVVRDEERVQPGQRVLVNGAGGGVGTFAVQLARAYGAEVTGVDRTGKLEMLRSIGAHHVVDYTREDVAAGDERYDLVFDIASTLSVSDFRRILAPGGTYVLVGHDHFGEGAGRWFGSLGRFLKLLILTPFVRQLHRPRRRASAREAFAAVDKLVGEGKLTPAVGETYPLAEVQRAFDHLAEGTARGKIVLTV